MNVLYKTTLFLFFSALIFFAMPSRAQAQAEPPWPVHRTDIHITKALHLDASKKLIADITAQVKAKDKVYATINDGEYIRVTFERKLIFQNDNTIYAKPLDPAKPAVIMIYPVYSGQRGKEMEMRPVAAIRGINHEGFYKIMLAGLVIPTDTFEYKITNGVAINYIVDPTFTTLYSFTGATGEYCGPGPVLLGSTLYGMCALGGANGYGLIFSISTSGANFQDLHDFTDGSTDGAYPYGGLVQSGGTLYGMTYEGGASNVGMIFSMSTSGSNFTDLHDFNGTQGSYPDQTLLLSGSTLYGETSYGGTSTYYGVVFSISTNGSGFTVLYNFTTGDFGVGGADYGDLKISGTTLYGLEFYGGADGYGMIFSISTSGSGFTDLHDFAGGSTDGAYPLGSLTLSGSTLYGTTDDGGANNEGIVFSMSTTGTDFTDLYDFNTSSGGYNPQGAVTLIGYTLYGTCYRGGANGYGTLFSVSTNGTNFTDLYDFTGANGPWGNLVLSGNTLYGMTYLGGANALGSVFSYTSTSVGNNWYAQGWPYRKQITISHTMVANADQYDFPYLFSETSDSNLASYAQSSGNDILFTQSDGITQLPSEIDNYVSSTGQIQAWVQIPDLSHTTDTVIYMYYGNASAPNESTPSAVWDGNYAAVYHLPNGTTLSANDSTGNANNGTLENSPTATAGQIDGGAAFNSASTQYITIADSGSLDTTTAAFTVSAWVNGATFPSPISDIAEKGDPLTRQAELVMESAQPALDCTVGSGNYKTAIDPSSISTGAWHYLVGTFDGTNLNIYVDGVLKAQAATGGNCDSSTDIFEIGYGSDYSFNGNIDEVKYSGGIARSANWIQTEYNNESSSSTYTTVATAQQNNWYANGWKFRKQITIKHTMVSSSAQTDFPVLISETSDAALARLAQSNGNDILFTKSDGISKLPSEIEDFVSSTGQLQAWVQVPSLSNTTDTVIYMYYDNPSASNESSPTTVWDSNYMAVYHFPNGSTLTTNDSTGNGNNATNSSATAATGQIDGGAGLTNSTNVITAPASSSLNFNGPVTLEAWVYPTTSSQYQGIIVNSPSTNVRQYAYYLSYYGTGYIYVAMGGGVGADYAISSPWVVNAWNHVVVTADGSNLIIYLNGASVFSAAFGTDATTATASTYLGNDGQISDILPMIGTLDEARISNTARSANWIKTEYNNQSSPSTYLTFGAPQPDPAKNFQLFE